MHEDIRWFFGLLIVFAAIFFASGSFGKLGSNKPFLDPYLRAGSGTSTDDFVHIGANSADDIYYVPSGGIIQIGDSGTTKLSTKQEIEKGLVDAGLKADAVKKELAALEEARNASPLTGKLAIVNRNGGRSSATEYILLRASTQNKEKILITGLRLESSVSGRGASIPKGVPLIFQNQVNPEEPVYLSPGDSAYIITGRSPLGISFKLNKCTGFFTQFQTFSLSIPLRCPRPTEADLPTGGIYYNDACRDYINSLPSCRVILNPPASNSPECNRYVTTEINYTKCVNKHKNDSDFYDPMWQIYLARDETLWKSSRELIHLVDQNGKVIDAITY